MGIDFENSRRRRLFRAEEHVTRIEILRKKSFEQWCLDQSRETDLFLKALIGGTKRRYVSKATYCPQGYHIVRNVTKPEKILFFPMSENACAYHCLILDTSCDAAKFKAFNIKRSQEEHLSQDHLFDREETAERQAVFIDRAILVAETIPLREDTKGLLLTIVTGDRFLTHWLVRTWTPVAKYTLVASREFLVFAGGLSCSSG